jgi:predicted enzyme related to lactoylglutathione lyase
MLTTPQGAGAVGANLDLYFKAADIEATHAALVTRGAASGHPPSFVAQQPGHTLWIGFLRDPAGNPVGFLEEKR